MDYDRRVFRSSPPINWSREMGDFQKQEAERVMGYRFERPSGSGLIIRKPTPEERVAKDKSIDLLREELGERIIMSQASLISIQMRSAEHFAQSRQKAVEAMKRVNSLKRGGGVKGFEARRKSDLENNRAAE